MNQLIYDQLKKISGVDLPDFNIDDISLVIPKYKEKSLAVGKAYLIRLEKYLLNPPSGFNLHANWNKGIAPKNEYLYALIIQDMGKMIRIRSFGYDFDKQCILMNSWDGWLPKKSITVIKEMPWRA